MGAILLKGVPAWVFTMIWLSRTSSLLVVHTKLIFTRARYIFISKRPFVRHVTQIVLVLNRIFRMQHSVDKSITDALTKIWAWKKWWQLSIEIESRSYVCVGGEGQLFASRMWLSLKFSFWAGAAHWNFHQKDGNPKWGVSMGGPKQNGTFDHPEHQKGLNFFFREAAHFFFLAPFKTWRMHGFAPLPTLIRLPFGNNGCCTIFLVLVILQQ